MTNDIRLTELPIAFRERYAELVEIIRPFCDSHLNDEYKEVCCRMAADLCQDGSPILKGKANSWAAGIIWSVGRVNFLSDPSFEPSMTQLEFSKAIGVSPATISAKSREIWAGLDLMQLDPVYTLISRMDRNPLIWMVEVNGLLIDLRHVPREVQQAAFEQGLIPYVPNDEDTE
jgi:hypothetical protein